MRDFLFSDHHVEEHGGDSTEKSSVPDKAALPTFEYFPVVEFLILEKIEPSASKEGEDDCKRY